MKIRGFVLPSEAYHAQMQKQMRIQIPRLLRWKYRLDPGNVMRVQVTNKDSHDSQQFLARMQQGGRITVPKTVAQLLSLRPRQLVGVVVWLPPENSANEPMQS